MTVDEQRWHQDAKDFGWQLPPKAHWFFRLPFIRAVRATWIFFQVERHNAIWRSLGSVPSGYDNWVLYAVMRGWC